MELNTQLRAWELLPVFGKKVPTLEDYMGKPLLILFFNLGCPGCKGRALPFANRVVHEKDDSVQVIGIHSRFEGPEYSDEQLKEAKDVYYIRFPYFRDDDLAATFHKYKAGGTPHWVLADSKGKVVFSIFGSDPNNALLRLDLKIKELLQETN